MEDGLYFLFVLPIEKAGVARKASIGKRSAEGERAMQKLVVNYLIGVALVTLAGCATTYQSQGFTGGYKDSQIDSNTFLVEFRGNGYTSPQAVNTYLLYRCAELTATAGYDYFILLGTASVDEQSLFTTPGHYSATTTGSGSFATTTGTYTPGQTTSITKPGTTTVIKAFHGQKPPDNLAAFDAKEVLQHLGPTVRR